MLIPSGVVRILPGVLALVAILAPSATAQTAHLAEAAMPALELPDAPGAIAASLPRFNYDPFLAIQASDAPAASSSAQRTHPAGRFELTIAPDEIAPPMGAKEKVLAGLRGSVFPPAPLGWLASAGWSHLTDGKPNFGTDKGAFGERLGASAIRDISETIFAVSVFAPVFHEDPRYYQLGRGHSIVRRAVYAATRTFITRTDNGRPTPNFALLAGDAAGAALTTAYYPPRNTSFGEVFETFSGSVGGSALGFVVDEFIDDALKLAHLKKSE